MNLDTEIEVLLKFGSLETECVDGRSKKLLNFPHYRYMSNIILCDYILSLTHLTSLCLSVAFEILDCEFIDRRDRRDRRDKSD